MQDEKVIIFKQVVGSIIKEIRSSKSNLSINKFANEFDLDKGNLSRMEKGKYSIHLITAYKISEALGIKFSEFAKLLEERLGENFTLIDQ